MNNPTFKIKAIIFFNFANSILIIITGLILLYFTPFLGNIIREIASSLGYGSAQRFYFIISDFEYYSICLVIIFLIVSIILFTSGLGILKEKKWSRIVNKVIWSVIILAFPIGTLFGIYALWMITQEVINQI